MEGVPHRLSEFRDSAIYRNTIAKVRMIYVHPEVPRILVSDTGELLHEFDLGVLSSLGQSQLLRFLYSSHSSDNAEIGVNTLSFLIRHSDLCIPHYLP
jgi:hypothetical protein